MVSEEKARKSVEKWLGYKDHQIPKICCGNCKHSGATNPGANIPGLQCLIMDVMNKHASENWGNSQVHTEAVCNFHSRKS